MTQQEKVLRDEIRKLQQAIRLLNKTHFAMLTTIVHYCGGELTLNEDDYHAAHGLLLTESADQLAKSRTWRTRRVGLDGSDEPACGGLLPPRAGGDALQEAT